MMEMLDIKGTIVTIDAMGTQKDIAERIVKAGADYILAVKGNQETPAGGRGDDVQLRASRSRGHGRGQGARADRGQALPCVRTRCHHKNVPQGLAGTEVRRQGQSLAPYLRQGDQRGALLHQQPADGQPLQHLHPQPLGGREQAPLDARHDLPRGPAAQKEQDGRTELLSRQEVRSKRPKKGQFQAQPRKQTA